MLVLTRSLDEEIRIGDRVIVRVLEVKGERVRIGIEAPPEVPVHRQEVYEEIERANRAATEVERAGLDGARKLAAAKRAARTAGRKSAAALAGSPLATKEQKPRGGSPSRR